MGNRRLASRALAGAMSSAAAAGLAGFMLAAPGAAAPAPSDPPLPLTVPTLSMSVSIRLGPLNVAVGLASTRPSRQGPGEPSSPMLHPSPTRVTPLPQPTQSALKSLRPTAAESPIEAADVAVRVPGSKAATADRTKPAAKPRHLPDALALIRWVGTPTGLSLLLAICAGCAAGVAAVVRLGRGRRRL